MSSAAQLACMGNSSNVSFGVLLTLQLWMNSNRFRLNVGKAAMLWFTTPHRLLPCRRPEQFMTLRHHLWRAISTFSFMLTCHCDVILTPSRHTALRSTSAAQHLLIQSVVSGDVNAAEEDRLLQQCVIRINSRRLPFG
jgi:hypothetical protein